MRTQIVAFVVLLCIGCHSATADQRRRIYFLESLSPTLPAAVRTIDAFKKRLSEKTTEQFDIFIDYMELVRFPTQAHVDRTVQYLSGKYREAPPDIVITLGRAALPFMAKYRDAIAPDVPIIMTSVPTRDARASNLQNVFSITTEYSFSKTIDLAQRLQPNARDLVVVGGASEYDRQWLDLARGELQQYSDRYTIKFIAELSYYETLEEVSRLPKDTIVMMSFFFADGAGQPQVSPEVAAKVAQTSPAPVYSPISTNLGTGIVGGYMDSWEEEGIAAADVAFEILSGRSPDTIPRENTPLHAYQVDERQLERWGMKKSRLPPGSTIRFHQFDAWEQYHWEILGMFAILLLQASVITGLVIERRRRRAAESQLRQRLLEILHLNRTALAGALSSSVAHELGQPLGAIQNYTEAAIIYLKQTPPNLAKVEEILASIQRDDERAANIISHLRGLLKKRHEVEAQKFDLNEIINDTMQVVGAEAIRNGVELEPYRSNGALPVRADRVQVQQVLVNLAMNGFDAMRGSKPGERNMVINTACADGSVEVTVADTGTGVPPDKLNKVFDAFYTTKGNGTGLGLSIARMIVETFGGRIWAENRPSGGALFRFTLPLLKGARQH
ncbi:MAG TPA: sensor histidine kinase [Pseudolabrys sp.]|nr:sensor histidine kinase [Pseudolabrys sp.]